MDGINNYDEYIDLLVEDLNMIFNDNISLINKSSEIDHMSRLKVQMLHLHADFLLSEIIKDKFECEFGGKNKKDWDLNGKDFMEKLRVVYATGDFDAKFFDAIRTLNGIRNKLNHRLLVNFEEFRGEIKRIETPQIPFLKKDLSLIEHLVLGLIGYMNILAEYLFLEIRKGSRKNRIFVFSTKNKISFALEEIQIQLQKGLEFVAILDYECPFCKKFWIETLPKIDSEYLEEGLLKLVTQNFPLTSIHPNAQISAEAVECVKNMASDKIIRSYQDKIFLNQNSISKDNLILWAKELGQDISQHLGESKFTQKVLNDSAESVNSGARGTPHFLIGKKSVAGAVDFEFFKQVIDSELTQT